MDRGNSPATASSAGEWVPVKPVPVAVAGLNGGGQAAIGAGVAMTYGGALAGADREPGTRHLLATTVSRPWELEPPYRRRSMALHIHRAERAEALADELASVLARPLTDPFAAEVVAVPGMGVQRWLAQRLAGVLGAPGGDGICANVRFAPVGALVAEALGAATGIAAELDPWVPERMVWTLLRVLDASIAEPWCAVPARHLGVGDPSRVHRVGRRFATSAGVAALFDGYAAQRPALISEWAAGADTDGCGNDLPEDLRWQPELAPPVPPNGSRRPVRGCAPNPASSVCRNGSRCSARIA